MKSIGQKINVVSDPLIITAQIEVDGTADQIFNPSRNEWIPNRKVLNNEVKMTAVLKGYDPNISSNGIVINNVVWAINGNQISDYGDGDFVVDSTNHTLTCYANGTGNSAFNIEATIHYYNTTTGDREVVTASKSITTTMNDAEEFVLVPTTSQDGIYNPMRGEGGRYVEFGCKLMSGNKQTPAVYRWFVITWDSDNKKIETAVNGTESWFKGGYSYNYEEDENGVIIEDSWKKKDSLDANTWGAIKVDLEYAQGVNLVVKAGASWAGETNSDVKDSLQLKYRASREFPMLKQVNMHAVQGYVTKPNGNLEASVFKAYARVFVGSEELDGAKEDEKDILEKYFNLTWYKTINNVKTRIGYGAVLSITYKDLGIVKKDAATNNPSGIEYIDKNTIPSIHVEVSENYISGGVQGAVYSNYETPNPKAVFGNDSIADELAAYLVETTYNEDGTTTIDAKRLMKNNWFRFENGQPAPTLLCNEAQYANILTIPENEREYNNNGEWTYLGVPVACYNPPEKNSKPSGINLNLDILYGWSEPVWTVEMHTNNSGEVVCYFAKEPFEIEEDGKVLEAVKIPPTLICPGLPTLHDGKFRTMFFMPGCGFGSIGTMGVDGIFNHYYGRTAHMPFVATGISNNNNNTYSFAKNKDVNSDNTPYAPLMTWYHDNILNVLEMKYKSACLHSDDLFGRGVSSNPTTQSIRTRAILVIEGSTVIYEFNATPPMYDSAGKQYNISTWLSNQGARLCCLEQQLVISYAVETNVDYSTRFNVLNSYSQFTIKNINGNDIKTGDMSAEIIKYNDPVVKAYNASGEEIRVTGGITIVSSCVHGIDLVSADVLQCQNGIENILKVEQESNVDGNPRTIWICKDQTKLYRGEETTIASGEKYPFETDDTYELLGESKIKSGWGNDFLRGTCIPTKDGGSLSKISGYYYASNYGNTTKGNRNRMSFRRRGWASSTSASARVVIADGTVASGRIDCSGGFQIRLPEPTMNEIDQFSYGIEFDTTNSSPTCERIGNMNFHRSLPVQSQMVGVLLDDDGNEVKVLSDSDWQNASLLDGSQGQVMIRIPAHYRKFDTIGTKRRVRLSTHALDGFHLVPMSYVSAYEATVDRENNMLASVKNTTAKYRGGNNTASWDGTYRSLLGMPATNIDRTDFRSYARKRKEGSSEWNCMTYDIQKTLYWLFVTEFATLNSQASFVEHPNYAAMHRGGLGDGVTKLNSTKWDTFNGRNPVIPCGTSDSLGNNTGEVIYTMPTEYDTTTTTEVKVPRYRGIENPFGHIMKWTDGINVRISPDTTNGGDGLSKVYVCSDTSKFNDSNYDGYNYVGNEARTGGYIKEIVFGEGGEIMPSVVGGSSTQFHCDNHYTSISTTEMLRGVLFDGNAEFGANAGLVSAFSNHTPSTMSTTFGSRLCFIPQGD